MKICSIENMIGVIIVILSPMIIVSVDADIVRSEGKL